MVQSSVYRFEDDVIIALTANPTLIAKVMGEFIKGNGYHSPYRIIEHNLDTNTKKSVSNLYSGINQDALSIILYGGNLEQNSLDLIRRAEEEMTDRLIMLKFTPKPLNETDLITGWKNPFIGLNVGRMPDHIEYILQRIGVKVSSLSPDVLVTYSHKPRIPQSFDSPQKLIEDRGKVFLELANLYLQ